MKKLSVIVMILFAANFSFGQNSTANSLEYKTAIGIKLWSGGGATLKTFISEKNALEFIGYFDRFGTRITGLYEIHGNLNTDGNLRWYLGPGAHVGLYRGVTAVGVDGVIGVDYKFTNMPLNLALDWQPSIEFGSGSRNGFQGSWGGFAIRYTL